MVTLEFKRPATAYPVPVLDRRTGELMAYCPGCKSIETIWFDDGTLLSTRKFTQRGDLVYHDCGSERPCRLYRNS